MNPYGRKPTKFQAAVSRAQATTRRQAQKAGAAMFGSGATPPAVPRRELETNASAGPINPRVRDAAIGGPH